MGLFVAVIMVYSMLIEIRTVNRYVPLVDAASKLKFEAAIGHLWFEEAISGDRHREIATAWEHLDNSSEHARTLLEGGENEEGRFAPLVNPHLRRETEDVLAKITDYKAIARERWASVGSSGIGSDMDERFDAVFEGFLVQAGEVETELKMVIGQEQRRIQALQYLLIVLCLVLSTLVGVILRRYNRRRARDLVTVQESEEKYRALFDNAPLSYQSLDEEGRFLDVNPAWLKTLGYDREEVIGKHYSDFLHPEWMPRFEKNFPRFKRTGHVHGAEFRIRHRDGHYLDILFEGRIGRLPDGGFRQTYCVFQDVTDLRQSEEKEQLYSRVLENSRNEIFIFDAETFRFIEVNRSARENLGYTLEELRSLTPLDLKPEFTAESFAELVTPLRNGKTETVRFTTVHRRKDGSHYPVDIHLQLMTDGDPVFAAIILDTTERKRSEEELERQLRTTHERVKELRCMYGVAESIRKRETLDLAFEETVALIPPGWRYPEIARGRIRFDDKEFISAPFEETEWRQGADIVADGEPRGTVDVFYTKERPKVDEGPFLKEERDLLDGIARALGGAIEQALAEAARERLTRAIEQASETVVITDADGVIQYTNPVFERVTGYTCEEAIGQNPRILKSDQNDDAIFKAMWETLTRGDTWSGRLVNKKKDGSLFTEEATISPVRDASGKTINYIAVKRDITQEIKLEARLRQAQKMESIGTLTGGIAHDFNNILGALMGYTELAKDSVAPDSGSHEYLFEIERASVRARDLVSQILAFSRSGDRERKPLRIQPVLEEALKLLSKSIPSTITLTRDISPDCEEILGDATQIHQVIMNLCTNGYQAMHESRGTLAVGLDEVRVDTGEAAAHKELKEGLFVRLTVSDTGRGMNEATTARIFEPYFTTKEVGSGTGLGLASVLGIVTDHGGVIEVSSKPGEGTTFDVYFPICARAGSTTGDGRNDDPAPAARGEGEHILFVDDETPIVNLYRTILEGSGYEITALTSSTEALDLFRADPNRFDAVVTDQTMPRMTGLELTKEILAIRPDIPIVLCTGFSETVDEEEALTAGVCNYVMKPVLPKDLMRIIRHALDESARNKTQEV